MPSYRQTRSDTAFHWKGVGISVESRINEDFALAEKYLPNGSCGVIAFGLKGDRETAIKFMDSLDMINIVTHVADARTCVLHPASHTHRQLSDEQLREAGVAPDLIRLSVGIEDVEDILDDIKQALDKI